jgi:predicted DNA binding CopG/RHH family protein
MKKTKKTETPRGVKEAIESSEIVRDFLPTPSALVYKEDNIKVTLELSRRSISRFKRFAKKNGFPYQRMLRSLIDQYAEKALSDD